MTAITQATIVYTSNGFVVPVSNVNPLPTTVSNIALSVSTLNPNYTDGTQGGMSMDTSGNLRIRSPSEATAGGPDTPQMTTSIGFWDPTTSFLLGVGYQDIPGAIGPLPVQLLGNAISLGASANAIGSVSQSNALLFHATVANAANFEVFVENFPAVQNVALIGNAAISGTVAVSSLPAVTGTFSLNSGASVSLAAGSNAVGSVTVTGTPNVALIGNATIQGSVSLLGNTSVQGSVSINGNSVVTQTTPANLTVSSYTATSQVQSNPTITASSAYTAGNVVGGKLTFANAVRGISGVLQSITITCKSTQTTNFNFYLFTSNPSNTTWTDKSAPSINAADIPYLLDNFTISGANSGLGTMTIYVADNLGRAFNASSGTLYGILTCVGTPTFSSTSDLFITLTTLED